LIAEKFGLAGRHCVDSSGANDTERQLCVAAVADAHNLWPAFEQLNNSRGDDPYGELEGEGTTDDRWSSFCDDFERQYEPDPVVEPTRAARGDIARSLLYMHFVYGLPLEPVVTDVDLLLRWHNEDPPDEMERERENRIEVMRGSRNPLVPRAAE